MWRWLRNLFRCRHKTVIVGGGLFDDLWTCSECGLEKYPEVFPGSPKKFVNKEA